MRISDGFDHPFRSNPSEIRIWLSWRLYQRLDLPCQRLKACFDADCQGRYAQVERNCHRVSSEEQANEGVSLDAQEARLRAHCAANDLDLVHVYRDAGVSAGTPLEKRPEGAALLKALARKEACHVVALKLDRLFRNALDCLTNVEKWDKAGVGLHLLDLSVNTSSAAGRAFLQMAAAFAEMERSLIRERTETAMAHKKANLEVYSASPFGYNRVGERLVANVSEQGVIQRIKAMDAEGVPMLRIAERLNAEGVTTKKGGKWYASTIRAILTNSLHGAA